MEPRPARRTYLREPSQGERGRAERERGLENGEESGKLRKRVPVRLKGKENRRAGGSGSPVIR